MRGRERDRLCKKTKVGALGGIPLTSGLTLYMPSRVEIWKARKTVLASSVQLQPCKDPEDCPGVGVGGPSGRLMAPGSILPTCCPKGPPIRLLAREPAPSLPALPLPSTVWLLMFSCGARQTGATDISSCAVLCPHNSPLSYVPYVPVIQAPCPVYFLQHFN